MELGKPRLNSGDICMVINHEDEGRIVEVIFSGLYNVDYWCVIIDMAYFPVIKVWDTFDTEYHRNNLFKLGEV